MILDEARRTLLASIRSSDAAHLHGRRWFYVCSHGVFLNPDERLDVLRLPCGPRVAYVTQFIVGVDVCANPVLAPYPKTHASNFQKKKASRRLTEVTAPTKLRHLPLIRFLLNISM
jgi:hypothetical protein